MSRIPTLFAAALIACAALLAAQADDTQPTLSAQPSAPDGGAVSAPVPATTPGDEIPLLRTADGLTTMPAALKAPEYKDLHDLMEEMKEHHRKALDPDPAVGLRAAKEVEHLSIAAGHESLRIAEDDYVRLLADLYTKNQKLQTALREEAPRPELMEAFKGQNNSCNACHKIYRKDDDH